MNKDIAKKTGRLMVAGFDGTEHNEHARFLTEELFLGNWILFARNISGYEQTAELNRKLIADTGTNNGTFPLMTIDQEGGIVSRLHGDLNLYPGAMACAAAGGPETTKIVSEITARHLRRLGFNMNLAPVADINSNPLNPIIGPRSYGDTPEKVTAHILAAQKGYMAAGCIPVLKHFPGHGDSAVDSHKSLPELPHPLSMLENREIVPFIRGFEAGTPAVMVAHLQVPAVDPSGLPASLSSTVIQGLLRRKLGFQGLVLTDCLEMMGIRNDYSIAEAVLLSLQAGADLFFISHTPDEQEEGFKAVYDAVVSGKIPESRLDESLGRIEKCKKAILPDMLENAKPVPGWFSGIEEVELKSHISRLTKVSRQSITLLRNRLFLADGLPDGSETLILIFQRPEQFIGENTVSGGNPMLRLKEAFPASAFRLIAADKTKEELHRDPIRTEQYKRILAVSTCDGRIPEVVETITALSEESTPLGVAVMRSPYEAAYYPRADFLALGYENTMMGVESLTALLKGQIKGEGTCPVELVGL